MLEHIKKNKKEYIIISILIILFSIVFIGNRYASDTYILEAYGYRNNAIDPYFSAGRFAMTAYLGIMGILNISFSTMKLITFILSVIFLIISASLMYKIIDKHSSTSKILKIILSFMMIFNVFVVEYFYFTEYTAIQTLGVLLSTITTYYIIIFFAKKNKKSLIIGCVTAFLSTFCYQGTYSLLVLLPISFTFLYAKNIKQFIYNNSFIALIYAIPSVITLIITNIFQNDRIGSEKSIVDGVIDVINGTKNLLINTHEFLPRGLYISIFFILIITIIIIIKVSMKKLKLKQVMFLLYIITAVIIVTLLPSLLTKDVWIMPRSNIGLGLLVPIVALYIVLYLKELRYTRIILTSILTVFLLFQLHGNVSFAIKQYNNNILTNYEMTKIDNEIKLYEEKNSITIENILIYKSENTVYAYNSITPTGDNNLRTFSIHWAIKPVFDTYYKDKNYDIEVNEIVSDTCETWFSSTHHENNIYFDDDTANICIY